MKQSIILAVSTLAAASLAQLPAYAQCGGQGHTGSTLCVDGFECVYSSEWYSQCLPVAAATTTTRPASSTRSSSLRTSTTRPATTARTSSTRTTRSSSTKTTKASTTKVTVQPTLPVPPSAGVTTIAEATVIAGSYDGGMLRWERGPDVCQGQKETNETQAVFILEPGASIKNAIIGATQAEGIHCRGPCTIENVWWLKVCEDAATFRQPEGESYVIGGGAYGASDKIFQFNGRGTVHISNFIAVDYGKLLRSCGDCTANGGPRHVRINNVTAIEGAALCGINVNFGDTCIINDSCQTDGESCDRYQGVVKGNGSSKKLGEGPDGVSCITNNFSEVC